MSTSTSVCVRRVTRQSRKRQLELDSSQGQDTFLPHNSLNSIKATPTATALTSSSSFSGGSDADHNCRLSKTKCKTGKVGTKISTAEAGANAKKTKRIHELAAKVMMNPLVLERITETLEIKSVLQLRQTCIDWNLGFLPEMKRNTRQIELSCTDIQDHIKIIRSHQNLVFTRYKFRYFTPPSGRMPKKNPFQQFTRQFGATITSLYLDVGFALPLTVVRSIIFESTPNLNQLSLNFEDGSTTEEDEEELSLHHVTRVLKILPASLRRIDLKFYFEKEEHHNPAATQLLTDIIQCATTLVDVHICELSGGDNFGNNATRPTLSGLLQTLVEHVHKIRTLILSSLKIEELQTLIELGGQNFRRPNRLRLDSFSIDIDCGPAEPDVIEEDFEEVARLLHAFLITQSASLKKLTVNCHLLASKGVPLRLPRMEALKKLKIGNWKFGAKEIQFDGEGGSRQCVDTFPSLRKINCSIGSHYDGLNQLFHPGVTDLSITDNWDGVIPNGFGNVFPSVANLKMKLNSRGNPHPGMGKIVKIWSAWPRLIRLKFCGQVYGPGDTYMDELFTGVPRNKMEDLELHLESIRALPASEVTPTLLHEILAKNKYKSRGGISDLKELREVIISNYMVDKKRGQNNMNAGYVMENGRWVLKYKNLQMTDIGGYFGLALASPHLQRVEINGMKGGDGRHLLSDRCREQIRRIFGTTTTSINI